MMKYCRDSNQSIDHEKIFSKFMVFAMEMVDTQFRP